MRRVRPSNNLLQTHSQFLPERKRNKKISSPSSVCLGLWFKEAVCISKHSQSHHVRVGQKALQNRPDGKITGVNDRRENEMHDPGGLFPL